MDIYTKKTKEWLENRFKKYDNDGIYYAHQPIYGFRMRHCEYDLTRRYIITYNIMKMLSYLKFSNLLDVGGAEGYKSFIVRELFRVKVRNSDLSEEACKRAMEIFKIDSDPIDIHNLPYNNNQFDIVICSETLEHVKNVDKAISEIVRVAKKAVLITVPYEIKEKLNKLSIKEIPHRHIHTFTLNSFDYLKSRGYKIIKKKIYNKYLALLNSLLEIIPISPNENKFKKIIAKFYNPTLPILKYIIGKNISCFILKLDSFFNKLNSNYGNILFLILKNKEIVYKKPVVKVSILTCVNFKVPFYYLKIMP